MNPRSPVPARHRLLQVLRLQPMTKRDLALCVGVSESAIEKALRTLLAQHVVQIVAYVRRGKGRAPWVYGLRHERSTLDYPDVSRYHPLS
jgi:predicted ArsR family transcriptional regulator